MALERKNRIKEQTTTTGTGTVTLNGTPATGYLTFTGNVSDGATVRYLIETPDKTEWEVGEGVFTNTGTTLSRDTVFSSSNSGNLVDFSAGNKYASVIFTAEDALELTNETPYKITPTVTSNNLTVALKHLDGSNPTTSNPIRIKIGDAIRSITSALSVTKNAGTNWCNAGSAELATKEIDYFVYLGYNTTDGVTIGFARIPYANVYSDFSTTTTDEKYCGISTITNASSNDVYANIGRFAATLSAGSAYTWSVPTFTAKNLIQRPIYETRRLNFALSWDLATVDNGSGGQPPHASDSSMYQIVSNSCKVILDLQSAYKVGAGDAVKVADYSYPIHANPAIAYAGIGQFYSEWNSGHLKIAVMRLRGETGAFELRFNQSLADDTPLYGKADGEYFI